MSRLKSKNKHQRSDFNKIQKNKNNLTILSSNFVWLVMYLAAISSIKTFSEFCGGFFTYTLIVSTSTISFWPILKILLLPNKLTDQYLEIIKIQQQQVVASLDNLICIYKEIIWFQQPVTMMASFVIKLSQRRQERIQLCLHRLKNCLSFCKMRRYIRCTKQEYSIKRVMSLRFINENIGNS